jgi:hypothetical protein
MADVQPMPLADEERWFRSTFNTDDWSIVPIGTRLVVASVCRPRHLPSISVPREDGLHEVILHRVKKHIHTFADGTSEPHDEPIFVVPGDQKKRQARVWGEYAFADDLGEVSLLIQFLARRNEARAHKDAEIARVKAERAAAEKSRRDLAREDRRRRLEAVAAEEGLAVEELEAAISKWNTIRRRRYPEGRCFLCGRHLTDPASIVTGVGPECVKQVPFIKAAARAKVLDVGRLRFDGGRLIERFERAGITELATFVANAQAEENT